MQELKIIHYRPIIRPYIIWILKASQNKPCINNEFGLNHEYVCIDLTAGWVYRVPPLTGLHTSIDINGVRWFMWPVLLMFTARGLRRCCGFRQAGGCVWRLRRRQQHLPRRVRTLHASSASRRLQSHRPDPSRRVQRHHIGAEAEPQLLGWVFISQQESLLVKGYYWRRSHCLQFLCQYPATVYSICASTRPLFTISLLLPGLEGETLALFI
jgi:hypothetical protein